MRALSETSFHARDVLVALSVAKLQTPREEGVAAGLSAPTTGRVASWFAEATFATRIARTRGVAVHVVPGPAAVRRIIGEPPTTHHGVRGAVVVATDGAAELRESGTTRAPTAASGVAAFANQSIRRSRLEREVHSRTNGNGAAHERGPVDEVAAREATFKKGGRPFNQCGSHTHVLNAFR